MARAAWSGRVTANSASIAVNLGFRVNLLERIYPESCFGGYSDRDGTATFYGRIQSMLSPGMTVLDVGCGRGAGLVDDPVRWRRDRRRLRGRCERVIGIDVDPAGSENPGLDEFRHLRDPSAWPIDDASVDLVLADFVLEHIEDLVCFFAEVNRALKSAVPGEGGTESSALERRTGWVTWAS